MIIKPTRLIARGLASVALAVAAIAAALWQANHVKAFNPQPDPPAFGMIGIIREQTARLNVINWGDVNHGPCRSSAGKVDPGPCRVGSCVDDSI